MKLRHWLAGIVIAAASLIAVAVVPAGAMTAAHHATAASEPGSDYKGPFVTMKVPAVCAFPQADLRYYTDGAPAGSQFLRSGAHGHGGYLRCIYFAVTGTPASLKGDHPYGKWLVFLENGTGLLIPATGIEVSYLNCKLPGYHFPYPAGNGQPNDCGESWLQPGQTEIAQYLYQDNTAGDQGKPMYPPVLP